MYYNEELADTQGLTAEDRLELDELYLDLAFASRHPETFDNIEEVVRQLEFALQKTWKFPQDPAYHRYQTGIRGCACPKMDNRHGFRYRSTKCPWHGRKV